MRRVEGDGGAVPGSMMGSSHTTYVGREWGSGEVDQGQLGEVVLHQRGAGGEPPVGEKIRTVRSEEAVASRSP